jgi:hypothetical protein
MIVKLFDIQNNVVIPTEHCYTLVTLKKIMDNHPDDYLKIYQYLFYMTCPNPDINPFFNVSELDKEEIILQEIDADFSTDNSDISAALKFCSDMYETPTSRAYKGIKQMLDRLGRYMETTEITHGRDGNINSLVNAAAKYQQIRESYKGAFKDLQDEQKSQVRGGQGLAYDQLG